MGQSVVVNYIGTTPGADSNTYNIFSTIVSQLPCKGLAMLGLKRLVVDMKFAGGNGTLKWYKCADGSGSSNVTRGTNWKQIGEAAIAAPAANATVVRDFLVEEYNDFKLDWVNGGSAQTTWELSIALTDDRALAG